MDRQASELGLALRDLIGDVQAGRLTADEAEDVVDEFLRSAVTGDDTGYETNFGMSRYEATAYLKGATLGDLAWGREHPVGACAKCGRSIDVEEEVWTVAGSVDDEAGAGYSIVHIGCPEQGAEATPAPDRSR